MFQITGTLKSKQAEQQVSDKFRKREFVITENSSQYPQMLSFQLTQDRCSLIENVNVSDEIKVHFNLRGREWSGPDGIRYFNSLEAWRLERASSSAPQPQSQASSSPISTVDVMPSQEIADDLPF